MSLSCLKDWLGIQGCGLPTPRSGFYINSMAGINLNTLEKLTKEESPTFLLLWNEIQDRAIRRMQLEVQSKFSKKYKIQNIRENFNLEKDYDSTQVTSASAQYRGLYIDSEYYLNSLDVKRSS